MNRRRSRGGRLLLVLLLAFAPALVVRAAPLQRLSSATMEGPAGMPAPRRSAVPLPFDQKIRAAAGSPQVWRFEVDFQLDSMPHSPLVATFYSSSQPQLSINAASLLAAPGDPTRNPDPRYVPVRFDLPPALLREGLNRLQITIAAPAGRLSLSDVTLGPLGDMEAWYRRQLWSGSTGFKVSNLAIVGIANFFLVLWTCRRRDSIYGLLSLSGFLWVACQVPKFAMPLADAVPAVACAMALLAIWFCATLIGVGVRLLDPDRHTRTGGLWAGAALASVAWLAAAAKDAAVLPFFGPVAFVLASGTVLLLALRGLRRPSREGAAVLGLSAWVLVAGFSSDLALAVGLRPWPAPRLSSYGVLLYVVMVGGWLVNRFIREREALDRRKPELENEARRREEALAVRYAAAAELDRRCAAAAERERFLAEVHEGLGAHLQQSRAMAGSGQLTATSAEGLLNAALNELRISIESGRPDAQDLLVMLGNQRYRLESRLRRAGISLEWDIRGDVPAGALSPAVVADISRITYEAFTNAICHSGATRLLLQVRAREDAGIAIEIIDNGRGFDVAAINWGRGLRKVQQLATRMKAEWSLSSRAGETRLELTL